MLDKAAILEERRSMVDPAIGNRNVELKIVRDIWIHENGKGQVKIALTVQHCPMAKTLQADVEKAVGKLDGVKSVNVETTAMSKKELEELRVKLTARGTNSQTSQSGQNISTAGPGINKLGKRGIRNIIAIVSGKGGVGKSFVTSMLATELRRQGYEVGVLDADLTGPSIAKVFGLSGKPYKAPNGLIVPAKSKTGIKVMSINLILDDPTMPVIWRGPIVNSVIRQLYWDVDWGDEQGLIGEIIRIEEDKATVQVYEETAGIRPGEVVERTSKPLSVELGPGITGQIYDGIQRPLTVLFEKTGPFVRRGVAPSPLDRGRKWHFVPEAESGSKVTGGGDVIGEVKETSLITQRIMVPPNLSGRISSVESEGDYALTEPVAELETSNGPVPLFMMHTWPVRIARPFARKLPSDTPLITGQRIMDFFFPIVKGGTAAIPGGFGTGKTVSQQQLSKWADAKVIVYVGCGERGNEMAEVLETFPKLTDPRSGEPLMNRTILVANTSNMPIAAREASVYTGITIAEYFRDMGYDVALMAED